MQLRKGNLFKNGVGTTKYSYLKKPLLPHAISSMDYWPKYDNYSLIKHFLEAVIGEYLDEWVKTFGQDTKRNNHEKRNLCCTSSKTFVHQKTQSRKCIMYCRQRTGI